jgi:hypothetical protein
MAAEIRPTLTRETHISGTSAPTRARRLRAAEFAVDDEGDEEQAQQDGEVVVSGDRADLGEVAGADVLEGPRERDGVGLADELVGAAEEQHARRGSR